MSVAFGGFVVEWNFVHGCRSVKAWGRTRAVCWYTVSSCGVVRCARSSDLLRASAGWALSCKTSGGAADPVWEVALLTGVLSNEKTSMELSCSRREPQIFYSPGRCGRWAPEPQDGLGLTSACWLLVAWFAGYIRLPTVGCVSLPELASPLSRT